jgi:NADH:ubiquinone oxidoreductase subunit H
MNAQQQLVFGPFLLDLANEQLWSGAQTITLKPKALAVLRYLVMWGVISTFVVLPFSSGLIIADLNVGILYLTAMTALVVVGVLMAGWASNNKWSLLGGIRSAAQVISYEIPAGLAILPIVLLTGSLSMQAIIQAQGWAPWDWFVFHCPFTCVAMLMFYVASLLWLKAIGRLLIFPRQSLNWWLVL